MVHPCCGSSLKQGTKFLAILSMVLSVCGTILAAIFLITITYANLKNEPSSNAAEEEIYVDPDDYCIDSIIPEPLMILLILLLSILNLFLSIMLFIGAEQENLRVCLFWWRVSFALCLIDAVFLTVSVAVCTGITDIVINSAEILRSVYELWVVKAFMKELKTKNENQEGGCRVVMNSA